MGFQKLNRLISTIEPLNQAVETISNLVMPMKVAHACPGCSTTFCGYGCVDGHGIKMYRWYNNPSNCNVYDCSRQCSSPTPITC